MWRNIKLWEESLAFTVCEGQVLVCFDSPSVTRPDPLHLLCPLSFYFKTTICPAAEINEDILARPALSCLAPVLEGSGSKSVECTGHLSFLMYTVSQVIPQKSPRLCSLQFTGVTRSLGKQRRAGGEREEEAAHTACYSERGFCAFE